MSSVVLVTGATGFIGSAVARRLTGEPDVRVRAAVRRDAARAPAGVEVVNVGELDVTTDWRDALNGVTTIVHAAARVHVMRQTAADPVAQFRRTNVAGTSALARQAANARVRRIVFISSIKVNGERTLPSFPFTADDEPAPVDPYGVSKRDAEQELRAIARETGLEIVIIRPVLVYGPGVKGNFLSMLRWLQCHIPLPFGAVHNRRSLVALDNLVDLIALSIDHPRAANETFLVSDGEDLSTTDLLQRTGAALGKRALLVSVPSNTLRVLARVIGKQDLASRLIDSLQVDASKARRLLGWSPAVSVDEGLKRVADHFLGRVTR